MLAAILICGATVFTSCLSSEDNPVGPTDNLAEKLIGKWMPVYLDGNPVVTDLKSVYTFVSATKAYMSVSINAQQGEEIVWNNQKELDLSINGNKMTLTNHSDEHTTMVEEFNITAIDGSAFTANHKITVTVDGSVMLHNEGTIRFEKLTRDYRETVLGLWECEGLIGDETYNDGNDRLEFLSDGTYRYYRKDDAGQWQAVTNREFQDYFVDGTLLATRWKNQGEDELREWWEIESLSGDQMVWTALRQNEDGSTFQQKMTWKKIDLNIPENIIGKWMAAERNGQPELTNKKNVYTYVSPTKAIVSISRSSKTVEGSKWVDHTEADVAIDGNKVTVTSHPDEHTTAVDEYIITAINDTEFTAGLKLTVTVNGNVVLNNKHIVRFEKVTSDLSAAIVGTWEGHVTNSEGSEFDDGETHRWEYKADGTYVYYVKDGDDWVPYKGNTLNEYFVDGVLLCTRWIDNDVENREWWEIASIKDGVMKWKALRQKEDGSTYTATFEMRKVE